MPKKVEKHPKDMTSEEAMKHLFGKGHKRIKKHVEKLNRPSTKKA
jgi:hypothetical protein